MTCREGRGSMFIAKSNEEKRSMAWRIVISTASVLIILIGAFFLFKMFTGNPLEGTWVNEDSGAVLEIRDNGEVLLTETESGDGEEGISMKYTVDTKTKIFTVHTDSAYAEGILSGSYDYNIEKETLTLTEREYGDQIVFTRE